MSAEAFFSRLPSGKLNAIETELKDLLHRVAGLAQALLPSDEVTIHDWVERRIPGELLFDVDRHGRICVEPLPDDRSGNGHAPAWDPPPRASAPVMSTEKFLDGLPEDRFLAKEEALREVLLKVLQDGPTCVVHGQLDPRIMSAARSLMPPQVQLHDWVERRIGGEVTVYKGRHGQHMCRLAAEEAPASRRSGPHAAEESAGERAGGVSLVPAPEELLEFWATLPENAFTEQEEALRESLFEFLSQWQSGNLATLADMMVDRGISEARNALLPQQVTLRDWMQRRMGEELRLQRGEGRSPGEMVVEINEAAHDLVRARFEARQRSGASGSGAPSQPDRDFLDGLPKSELLAGEHKLRECLLRGLKRRGGSLPFQELATDSHVRTATKALLPDGVRLKDWIDHRVGMEIVIKRRADDQLIVMLRREHETERRPEDKEHKRQKEKARDDFFQGLPDNEFSKLELDMRGELMRYIEESRRKGMAAADLVKASNNPGIKELKARLLPKGCGVTLQDWIDRRMGGEIETKLQDGVIYFGLRDEMVSPDASGAPGRDGGRKRKGAGSTSDAQLHKRRA